MNISRGKKPGAKKVVIYGTEGIGKSTFASQFPDPVFIDTEDSTKDMDVARFDKPTSWPMLLQEAQYVIDHPECCKTLVIDTADWAEQIEIADLCAKKGWTGLEDPGYGKGYQYSAEEFGKFLNMLSDVTERGVNVVVTAHAWLRKVDLPDEMGSYDHWEMKTSKKVAPMIREWADMVLFCNYKTIVVNVDGQGAQKGKNKAQGGKRIMYTSHTPYWDAKNRYGLPDEVPFEYGQIRHIIEDAASARAIPQVMEPVQATKELSKAQQAPPAENIPDSSVSAKPVQQTMDLGAAAEKSEGQDFRDIPPSPDDGIWNPNAPDSRIPKKLRDLMIANHVCEWDIQNVVAARGYFPADMEVYDYPEDFIDGVLVGAWQKVLGMITEMKEKEAVPFN